MTIKQFYKLARPDGFDFHTGQTINYRENIGKVVKCPNANRELGLCSSGVIHASGEPNDCFVGAKIPCSAYLVEGRSVCGDEKKFGFLELKVISEITDLDSLFGWRYSEAVSPFNPLKGKPVKVTKGDIALLRDWDSVWASVWAYIGSLFPNIKEWKYVEHYDGGYPFQAGLDLWKQGLAPSFDGKEWRLHSGPKADVVWEGLVRR